MLASQREARKLARLLGFFLGSLMQMMLLLVLMRGSQRLLSMVLRLSELSSSLRPMDSSSDSRWEEAMSVLYLLIQLQAIKLFTDQANPLPLPPTLASLFPFMHGFHSIIQKQCLTFCNCNPSFRKKRRLMGGYFSIDGKASQGWDYLIIDYCRMSNKAVARIKSAAFIRKSQWKDHQQSLLPIPNSHTIADLPVSQSIIVSKLKQRPAPIKTQSMSKLALSRSSPSTSSSVWRKVHSTRSEIRLKSLLGAEEEPVRLNLMEKVDRIKAKHWERERLFEKNRFHAECVIKQRCSSLQRQGEKGELARKIQELLRPLERAGQLAEERYRGRLLRLSRH